MDRKSKIWQIVLLVLLIAAVIALVLFGNKLKDSAAQLAAEQGNSAALKAQLDQVQTSYDDMSVRLEQDAKASAEALAKARAEAEASAKELAKARQDAEASAEALKAQLTQAQSDAEASSGEADSLRKQLTQARQEAEASAESAKALKAQLTQAQSDAQASAGEADTLRKQLSQARLEADVSAHRLSDMEAAVQAMTSDAPDGETSLEDRLSAIARQIADREATIDTLTRQIAERDAATPEPEVTQAPEEASATDITRDLIERIDALMAVETDEGVNAQLEVVREELTGYAEALESGAQYDPKLVQLQQSLDAAQERYAAANAQVTQQQQTITLLNQQIEALNSQSETDAAQLEDLHQQLNAAVDEANHQKTALETSRTEYQRQLAEVEAYRLNRRPENGEAHAATSMDDVIDVAADGVSAVWHFENTSVSSNPVVLTLKTDAGTVYTSQPLAPGAVIDNLTLDAPLAPGTHAGTAVSSIYDQNGALLFANRIPVTIRVAG